MVIIPYDLIVLAGGSGDRLGHEYKPLVKIRGKPLIKIILDNLGKYFKHVIIVVKSEQQKALLQQILNEPHLLYTVDVKEYDNGPLVALYSGALKAVSDKLFVIPCDTPFITYAVASKMLRGLEVYEAVIPKWPNGYIEPLVAAYRRIPLLQASRKALTDNKRTVRSILECLKTYYIDVYELSNNPIKSFLNINTWEDLKRAEKFMKSRL